MKNIVAGEERRGHEEYRGRKEENMKNTLAGEKRT
jgi:hypothetical protein